MSRTTRRPTRMVRDSNNFIHNREMSSGIDDDIQPYVRADEAVIRDGVRGKWYEPWEKKAFFKSNRYVNKMVARLYHSREIDYPHDWIDYRRCRR